MISSSEFMVPKASLNPFSWYRQMQKESPVCYDPDYMLNWGAKGVWHVFRYEDVKNIFADFRTFSSQYVPNLDDNPMANQLVNLDPPIHKHLRATISKAFVPATIDNLEPWIRQLSHELIDAVLDSGEMDFVNDIAVPIPIHVITRLLGVPDQNVEQVHEWSKRLTDSPNEVEDGVVLYQRTQQEIFHYFIKLITERREKPQNDLISDLIVAEVDGKNLNDSELASFCIILLLGGNETTISLLGNTVLTLIEHPETLQHLMQTPSDIPKAIQEVLRYRSPIQTIYRIATRDVELGGQQIKKGDILALWMGSANHDPAVFPNPEIFDINRNNHQHVAFGHGIHYCIGAPLAKLETKVALEVLFQKINQIQLKPGTTLEVYPSTLSYSLKSLPITFNKR